VPDNARSASSRSLAALRGASSDVSPLKNSL
jgi:hypothetical protein